MDYTIKRGDTLSGIAAQNNTTVSNLASTNNIANPNMISAGATIKIPKVVPVDNLNTPTATIPNPTQPQVDINNLQAGIANATGYNTASLQTAEADAQAQEKLQQQMNDVNYSDLARLQSAVGGQGIDKATQYNQVDANGNSVNTLAGKIRTLAAQSQNLATQNTLIPVQIQQNAANTGATDRGVAADQAGQLRNNLIQQATIAQQTAIAKADYETAKSFADQVVDAKYSQILADIEAKKTNLANIRENLTAAQKKTADATTARLEKEKADYERQIAEQKDKNNMLINASAQGAPSALVTKAQAAKTPGEAAMILGQYAGDYYKTELLKQQIATEKAQRSKIYSDVAKANAEIKALGTAPIAGGNIIASPTDLQNATAGLKLTEGQGKSLAFAQRAINADKALRERLQTYDPTTVFSAAGRLLNTDNALAFKRDMADFITAVLRKESGATITEDEFDRFIPIYSPQGVVTDEKDIAQTNTKRSTAIDALISEAGPAAPYLSSYKASNIAVTPAAPNKFQQAIGQTQSSIPGTSIINNVNADGSFDFVLPTTK